MGNLQLASDEFSNQEYDYLMILKTPPASTFVSPPIDFCIDSSYLIETLILLSSVQQQQQY
jgi:hypothetical protein